MDILLVCQSPVEPTFEFIEEDDVGVVIGKDVAPTVEGALGSKYAPLGLHPADNPVCVFGMERNEQLKRSASFERVNACTYPATSSYVVGWCFRMPVRTWLCPLLVRVSLEGSPPMGPERCGWGREERQDLSAPVGREAKRGRGKCRAATASSSGMADGKEEESSTERETKAEGASSSAVLRRRVAACVPAPERTRRKGSRRRRIGPRGKKEGSSNASPPACV